MFWVCLYGGVFGLLDLVFVVLVWFGFFSLETILTQRKGHSLTSGLRWEGLPNFFSRRNDGASFCGRTLRRFAGLSSSFTLRNLLRLSHPMHSRLMYFPVSESFADVVSMCVRALKVTRN